MRDLSKPGRNAGDFGPCAITIGNFDGVHVGHRDHAPRGGHGARGRLESRRTDIRSASREIGCAGERARAC